MRGKTATERKLARREAWAAAIASPFTPPRLRLGSLLVEVYQQGDAAGRAALAQVFAKGKLGWGVWRAIKTIYKLAEASHDLRDARRDRVPVRCCSARPRRPRRDRRSAR